MRRAGSKGVCGQGHIRQMFVPKSEGSSLLLGMFSRRSLTSLCDSIRVQSSRSAGASGVWREAIII